MTELEKIHKVVTEDIRDWEERTKEKKVAPFPSDSACYYCGLKYHSEFKACDYCIQNPEAKIYG